MIRFWLLAAVLSPSLVFGQEGSGADRPARTGVTIGPEGPVRPAPPPGEPQPPPPDSPPVHRLTVTPAAEPVPPLKYRFDVPYTRRKPGNATAFYYRALMQLGPGTTPENRRQFNELHEAAAGVPLAEFPVEKVREVLARHQDIFRELERGTVREETDWSWRLDELSGPESIAFLLPEIQEARHLARLLQLKAKLEVAEGRYEDAEQTLRMGYALARAVAEPPTIINDLVGVAIASVMNTVILDWIDAAGSPNVYWALASLPDPMIDLREAIEYELAFPFRFAPWLEDVESDDAPPAVWRHRFGKLMEELSGISGRDSAAELTHLAITGFALRDYPAAKRELIKQGYDPAQVEAMPVGKVLALRQRTVDRLIADELLKAALVSSANATEVGETAEASLKGRGLFGTPASRQLAEPLPLMALLAPATRQAAQAELRLETKFAGLRAIEAIRMHAAATGALPKSLEEIEVVPVPDNPTTGEPFVYRLDGETAVLEIAVKGGHPSGDWRVELSLEK